MSCEDRASLEFIREFCFCFPSPGVEGVQHHCLAVDLFFILLMCIGVCLCVGACMGADALQRLHDPLELEL